MKRIFFCSVFNLSLLLLSVSCKKEVINEKNFPSIRELEANTLKINEIIKSRNMYKLKDYVIICDAQETADDFFYVYNYPEFKFLYSFGKRGHGPMEYLMPVPLKNTPDNYFSFRDHAGNKFVTYLLTDTASIITYTDVLKPTDNNQFLWEINQVDDSLFLLKRQSPKWSRRELWNLYTKEIIDSIPNSFDFEKTMGNDYYAIFEDFQIASKNDRFALGYLLMDFIEIGSIKNNTMTIEKSIGTKKSPEFYLYGQMGGKYGVKFLNNVMYYEGIKCGEKYIYALYANVPLGKYGGILSLGATHSSCIEVYSWEGEPVTLLKLNNSLSDFFVDETTHTIYGINLENCEDCIFKYKYE